MLFWGVINCLILYGLIRLFERKRSEIDGFEIALAAIAPFVILLLARGAISLFDLGAWAYYVGFLLSVVAITLVLWRMAEIPLKRSVVYGLIVLVLNLVLNFALMGK